MTMSTMHGFEILEESRLPEYRSETVWARHIGSGCEFFHVKNDDPENLFCFAFKTLPTDSSGVAHILEHTVLCGSEKYQVKDPLILLLKGSLNTFLNAMTYPDKTIYPGSSTVPQDLFNLMKVYGDAVFFPLVREQMFRQEGHRLQFGDEGPLELTGIVYNEMKGVAANHDSVVGEWAYRSLLPDTPYAYDSGGDPKEIPGLTYEAFRAFHGRYYHPSNTRVFVYGDIPSEQYLEFLDGEYLSRFQKADIKAEVNTQPRWSEPRELVRTCPTDQEDGPTTISINWLLDPITDPYRLLSTEMMAGVLLSTSAAPLRKRLIESGLGDDLAATTGLESEILEMVFSVGLKGIAAEKKTELQDLVFDELRRLVAEGIDAIIVEAVMRKVEFRYREIKGGGPNGLRLMGKSLRGWLHGQPPDATLRFQEPFDRLKKDVAAGGYFEQLIQEHLLENSHRTTLTVQPDPQQRERENAELTTWLSETEARLSDADREAIVAQQKELEEFQATPDSAEAIASIPFLTTDDLPRTVETIDCSSRAADGGVAVQSHELFANGIVYLDVGFDLGGVPRELIPHLPLYTTSVTEVGLPGRPYDEVATEIALKTGGLGSFTEAAVPVGGSGAVRRLYFRMKCLESTLPEAVDLLIELMLFSEFGNSERLVDLIKEERSGIKSAVLPSGHSFVSLRSGRSFADADRYEDQWRGISQLMFLEGERPDEDPAVGDQLRTIRDGLVRRGNMIVNVAGSADAIDSSQAHIDRLITAVPGGEWSESIEIDRSGVVPRSEALIIPSDVGYVASAMPASRFGSEEHVHESVLAHLLGTGYLWEAVRMKGGAYGVGASARGMDGVFGFWSYRDPNITDTLLAYRTGVEQLASAELERNELELAIIGVTGRDLRPLSPGEKSLVSLRRSLFGVTDEMRQEKRDAVLATTGRDVQRAAERVLAAMDDAAVVVMGSDNAVASAAKTMPALVANQVRLPL